MPEVEHDGEVAPATLMRIIFRTSNLKEGAYVELTADNLHYVKVAMYAHQSTKGTRNKKNQVQTPAGSRWVKRGKRYGFLAARASTKDGCRRYKFFPTNTDDHAARDATQRWLDGHDTSEGEDGTIA